MSDGLIADLGHICRASGLGARIEAGRVPLSGSARAALARGAVGIAGLLTGGDDYELVFTAPAERSNAVREAAARSRVPVTRIGTMTEGGGGNGARRRGGRARNRRYWLPAFLGRARVGRDRPMCINRIFAHTKRRSAGAAPFA